MEIRVTADAVHSESGIPEYSWETYQRGFLGILNNAYNQSCNAGKPKLGVMSDIEAEFIEHGGGSWQDFVRFYMRQHNGDERVQRAIDAMADNLQQRVASIDGDVDEDDARYWARKYIWSMLVNTYSGFCSERTAIECVASNLDLPYTTDGNETAGIDGYIGSSTVQVKPETYMGLDLNDHDADYVITYDIDDDTNEFIFTVPHELTPRS